MRYEIKCRKVGGLETAYHEWVVSLCSDAGSELERIASFMHSGCAEGLRSQLQCAYEHGIAEAPRAQPTPQQSYIEDDWKASIADAHDSLNRLEDVALARLAESFEAEGAEQAPATHRDRYVDVAGTRVHLLADEPPHEDADDDSRTFQTGED